jgi:hypothetical protein
MDIVAQLQRSTRYAGTVSPACQPCPAPPCHLLQVRKLEAQHRAAKERLESEVRATSEAAEKIQGEVASMRCVVSASLADSEDKVRCGWLTGKWGWLLTDHLD